MTEQMQAPQQYDAGQIQVLEGLEAVRKRPGMYIGSTSIVGLHHLVWEIVDNSIDEALAGYCDHIEVTIEANNSITVQDNGRGIPVDIQPQTGRPAVETVFTVLHAGGKFGGGGYKVSGGLHGVGASVVNALSTELTVQVSRDGKLYQQRYHRGAVEGDLEVIGQATETGTKVNFLPDPAIFTETTVFEYDRLKKRIRELAFLNKGLRITIEDKRLDQEEKDSFHYEGGIKSYVQHLNQHKTPIFEEPIYIEGEVDDIQVEISMQYTDSYHTTILSFANNIHTHEGGSHEAGFKTGLTRVINDYARKMNLIKDKNGTFQGTDVREGLVCVISVKIPEPQFEGQTKTKLGNSEVTGIVSNIVGNNLKFYLEDHPKEAEKIIEKMTMSKRAREAAKKARELVLRKNTLEVGSLPGKLADCSSKDPSESEIFIVEGNSAGGSAKQGRDRRFQAILPLRGKILNVEKSGMHKLLENAEIRAMITAFGAGFGDDMDLEKLRYHKIIIMTDADVDGAHIRTLMLTFFYRQLRELINEGYIYIAQPPLYKVQAGKAIKYAYSDEQMKKITSVLERDNRRYTIQRYKGLGEMNPEQLWETTLDPEVRTLLKVTMEDASYADKMFNILMGDKVEPRRQFIEENANYVRNLDV